MQRSELDRRLAATLKTVFFIHFTYIHDSNAQLHVQPLAVRGIVGPHNIHIRPSVGPRDPKISLTPKCIAPDILRHIVAPDPVRWVSYQWHNKSPQPTGISITTSSQPHSNRAGGWALRSTKRLNTRCRIGRQSWSIGPTESIRPGIGYTVRELPPRERRTWPRQDWQSSMRASELVPVASTFKRRCDFPTF